MSPRPAQSRRRLPIVLSLAAHALALAALAHFAPGPRAPARDSEPVTVRLVAPAARPDSPAPLPQAVDRRTLPAETTAEPVLLPALRLDELLAETSDDGEAPALELPACARRGSIGVGALASLRAPRPPARTAAEAPDALAAPATVATACPRAEEVTAPVPLECAAPEYPAGAASVSEQGRVQLELSIDSRGRVEGVRLLRSSGFARLDEAALAGVRRWRFEPARRDGLPVAWRLEHTIVFRISASRS